MGEGQENLIQQPLLGALFLVGLREGGTVRESERERERRDGGLINVDCLTSCNLCYIFTIPCLAEM